MLLKEKKFYLTKNGLEKIKREYEDLKEFKFSKINGEFSEFLNSGCLNSECSSIYEELNLLELRLIELENILKNAKLIRAPQKKKNTINLGATVVLKKIGGHLNKFTIVGILESNPAEGKISFQSPLGKALMGRKIGDEISIASSPKSSFKIKKIKYDLLL